MTSVCKSCDLKSNYKYWNELPPIKKSFFKVMSDNFHNQMRVPKEFMDYFNGELGEWCILKGPSGKDWRVQKARASGKKTLFTDGWAKFVQDNCIMSFDYLVFSYCGDSSFQVSIYKKSGCERESAYFSDNSSSTKSPRMCSNSLHTQQDHASFYESEGSGRFEEPQYHNNGDEDDEVHDDNPQYHNNGDDDDEVHDDNPQYRNNGGDDNDVQDDNDDSLSLCLGREFQKNDKGKSPKNSEELDDSSKDDDGFLLSFRKREQNSTSGGRKQPQTVHISRRRAVTSIDEQKARSSASYYVAMNENSGRPMTMLTMLPTHVYQGFHMTIPKKWAKKHMCQVDHSVKLRVPVTERSWMIGCRWTPLSQCQFRSGWSTFVLDNNLEDHDVCVFELVRKGDPNMRKPTILDVHVFRVVAEVVPLKKVRKFN